MPTDPSAAETDGPGEAVAGISTSSLPWPRAFHVLVCTTSGRHHCGGQGSERVLQRLRDLVEQRGLATVRTTRMGCNQQHHQGPIVIVYPDGVWYGRLVPDDVDEIVERHLVGGEPVERLRITPDGPWSGGALT